MSLRRLGATLLALAAALAAPRAADEVRLRAYTVPTGTVGDTDPVNLVIVAEGTDLPDVSVQDLPRLVNLRVMSGPSSGRSTSFEMNGLRVHRSTSVTLQYTLVPERPGPADIPPIAVRIGSAVRRTDPIHLEVVRGSRGPAPGGGRTVVPRSGGREPAGADLFLKVEALPAEVWVRQPVFLEVKLYVAGTRVESFSWMGLPTLSSFWSEEIQVDPNSEHQQENLGGRTYDVFPVLRRMLMPTSPGDITLDPFAAQMGLRRSTGDLFEDFFVQGRTATVVRKTDPLHLRVKPLPEVGKPPDFSGAVGTFRLTAALDRKDARVNDAVALKVTVEGDGSLQGVSPPRLDAPADLKVFEPKASESVKAERGRLRATKTWEWVLVPLAPGEIRLPPIRFSYFDPAQGAYKEASEPPMLLAVRRGESTPEGPTASGEIRAQRQDIAFIKPLRGHLVEGRPGAHRRPLFVFLAVLPVVLAPVVVGVGRYRSRLRQDRGLARSRRARQIARKRLKAAEHHIGRPDTAAFHEEVARALVEYVADRFDRQAAGLTYDVADELLASKGIDVPLRHRFRSCLEACDFARFVPDAGLESRKAEVLREARDLVEALERSL